MARVYDITHMYGVGPFGTEGARQVFITETIRNWIDAGKWTPEGVIHDLYVMAPVVWRGRRRIGGIRFSTPQMMDLLERHRSNCPNRSVRFFTGVFPRLRGQDCRQILWWLPISDRCILIGVAEDLEVLDEEFELVDADKPPANVGGSWVGLIPTEPIDWKGGDR